MATSKKNFIEHSYNESRVAFDISSTALNQLKIILDSLGLIKQTFNVSTGDGSRSSFTDISDLEIIPNTATRPITKLTIEASALFEDPTQEKGESTKDYIDRRTAQRLATHTADIELRTGEFGRTTIRLSGRDDWRLKAVRDLTDWLKHTRPMYWWASEFRWWTLLAAAALASFIWAGWHLLNDPTPPPLSAQDQAIKNAHTSGLTALLTAGVAISMIAYYTFLGRFFRYLLPLGVFSFGQHGAERERRRSTVRNIVFGAVVLGMIINVVSNFISSAIAK